MIFFLLLLPVSHSQTFHSEHDYCRKEKKTNIDNN